MPRPKKEVPNRADRRFEVKITVGKDINGKAIRKSFYSTISKADAKKQADDWIINQKAASIAGINISNGSVTFEEIALLWLKTKSGSVKGNSFLTSYEIPTKKHLIPFFGKATITSILPLHIELFFNVQSEKFSQSQINKFRICLNAIFEFAIDNDKCYKNPVKRIKPISKLESHEKCVYTEAERDNLIKISDEYSDGLIIFLSLEFGLRCSEICALQWEDFDFENKTLHIQRASVIVNKQPFIGKPKSKNSERILPMCLTTSEYLKHKAKSKSGYIFLSKKGKPYTSQTFGHARYDSLFAQIQKEHPEVRKLSMHELRHTCGTLLYAKTKDIYAVSKYMGHSSVKTTERFYMHEDTEILRSHLYIE